MSNIHSYIITADTNGARNKVLNVPFFNANCYAPAIPNDDGTATTVQQIDHYLTGSMYSVEYDSTGEVYVQFLDRSFVPVTDVILLHRGVIVHVPASVIRVVGVRRAGILRVASSDAGYGVRVNNAPVDMLSSGGLRYAVSTNGSAGPAGWINTTNPYIPGNCVLSYSPYPIGFGGVLQNPVRKIQIGTFTAANFLTLSYGFVNVQNGSVNEVTELCNVVSNGVETVNIYTPTPVDIAPFLYPAIVWELSPAGITANQGPPLAMFDFAIGSMYTRSDLVGLGVDIV